MISKDLLDLIACPVCKGPLTPKADTALRCPHCSLAYPIRDGIPVLLKAEATPDV